MFVIQSQPGFLKNRTNEGMEPVKTNKQTNKQQKKKTSQQRNVQVWMALLVNTTKYLNKN